jgi:6-phosphogluconate dehydrogenase
MNTIGVFGLGVMGANLAANMMNKGESVAVYNYTPDLTEKFREKFPYENADTYYDLKKFVDSLEKPRKILLLVTAGTVVDSVIQELLPVLDEGDIIMDGGNSNFIDSNRRYDELQKRGIRFLGVGVSGGEEGALNGPALMPGGDETAYHEVAPILEKISAKAEGKACCSYVGKAGSGHYVKMIHNGIEYADMQLITETYQILREVFGYSVDEIADIFEEWNEGELESYLLEITSTILRKKDIETNQPLVDVILDQSGQKGTGKWTSQNALDLGVPLSIITESVFARFLSSIKQERNLASERLEGPEKREYEDNKEWLELLRKALFMGKMNAYTQGFYQYKKASDEYKWSLRLDEIALIFRGGCIIRASILNEISEAYKEDQNLSNLLLSPFFNNKANEYQYALRQTVIKAMERGIYTPTLSASLSYYDGYRSKNSGANIIQAQRDYFGAHTYQRIDKDGVFHTEW